MARPRITPLSAFGERLFAAVTWSSFGSLVAFRAATVASEHVVRAAESGAHPPRIDMVQEWASMLEVSPGWLAFGGSYPEFGRGRVCASILRQLPAPLVGMMGRFDVILRLGEDSGPTVAEWATAVRAWIEYTGSQLPMMLEEVTTLQATTHEFDTGRTKRFYPGLAEFLAGLADDPEGPTPEEREALRAVEFPPGLRPAPDVFRSLWESQRKQRKS